MANSIPIGIRLLPPCNALDRTFSYRIFILGFTFFIYTSYHLSRKPISVVKNALFHNSCHQWEPEHFTTNSTKCDWAPFDGSDHDDLLGSLDLAYLFAYAVGMFLSGHIAERMSLRYFLTLGMLSSGIMTAAFGFGYFFKIHVLWFYILVQVVGGMVQASGWPSVVTCVGNWWGKGKRGFIMGVWNSHTSVGNITGSLIAGIWVNHAWGWSFIVPGIIIGGMGILVFLFLVTEPSIVGCREPDQHDPTEFSSSGSTDSDQVHIQNHPSDRTDPNDLHGVEIKHLESKSPSTDTDGIAVYILDDKSDSSQIVYTHPIVETKFSGSKSDTFVNGTANGVELLNIKNLENQSKTGSTTENSGSSLVPGQNGEVVPVKKHDYYSSSTALQLTELNDDESEIEFEQDYGSATSVTPLLKKPGDQGEKSEEKAISIFRAIFIPGVMEFSLCLFFAKLVSYTFLFWLPKYIKSQNADFDAEESADLSTLFDVGGILGGITAGIISDYTGARAGTCAVMLILAAPMMYILNQFGAIDYAHTVGLLMACGYLVNGPYALITTAVSADLGTHKSLKGNSKALATVTAIIDGTGSIGAAIGPLLTGLLWKYGTDAVFWMLIGADLAALVFLGRLVFKEIMATRFCSPPLLIDDIVVDDDHKDVQNSTQIEKSHHL